MARPLRIEYAGAVYHVMARGDHGQAIFRDDKDRERFLETVGETCAKTGWRIHAYVLTAMRHYKRVTQSVSRMKRNPGWKLEALKQQLLRTEKSDA